MATPPGKGKLVGAVGVTAAAAILALVQPWEGKRNDPYADIRGIPTVCFGETQVKMRHYSDAECQTMLEDHLADSYAKPVLKRNPELRGRPYQLAAASSLAYNIGPANYARSAVAKDFSAGQWRAACDAFLPWHFAAGKPVQGLLNRRNAERRVCLTGLKGAT
jgi:lysozyme